MKNNYKRRKLSMWQLFSTKHYQQSLRFLGLSLLFGGLSWGAQAQSYCTPSSSYGCSDGDQLSNVFLEGESTTIDNATGCSPGGYGDYTGAHSADLMMDEE